MDALRDFVVPLLPLADCHTVDFFRDELWERLVPGPIKAEVRAAGADEALRIFCDAERDSRLERNFPELMRFVREARERSALEDERLTWDSRESCGADKNRFMSAKKMHEVEVISEMVKSLHDRFETTHVVDLGGGKGYLGSTLSVRHCTPVLNVDVSPLNEKGASERNRKLARTMNKNCRSNVDFYRHVVERVSQDTDLIKLVAENFEEDPANIKLCLTGLHACGSLGSNAVKLFAKSTSIRAMCVVPCCYHLTAPEDFPMSRKLKGIQLSRNARMLASQSVERASASKKPPDASLFYRALLEIVLRSRSPPLEEARVGRVGECGSFVEYARLAERRLKMELGVRDERIAELEREYEARRSQLHLFHRMRTHLAPAIEALILADACEYLRENSFDVRSVRLFDPLVSPRSVAVVAHHRQ